MKGSLEVIRGVGGNGEKKDLRKQDTGMIEQFSAIANVKEGGHREGLTSVALAQIERKKRICP